MDSKVKEREQLDTAVALSYIAWTASKTWSPLLFAVAGVVGVHCSLFFAAYKLIMLSLSGTLLMRLDWALIAFGVAVQTIGPFSPSTSTSHSAAYHTLENCETPLAACPRRCSISALWST